MSKNLLIILVDELAPDAVGYAKQSCVKTPYLDSLAEQGTAMMNAVTPSPICMPSRASIATGLEPHITKHWGNAFPYTGCPLSWSHILNDNEIMTAAFGKLHFETVSNTYGFAERRLILHAENEVGMLAGEMFDPAFVIPHTEKLLINSGVGEHVHQKFDDAVTKATIEFLNTDHNRPWCALTSLIEPHFDFLCEQEYFDLYTDEEVGLGPMRFNREGEPWFHDWVARWKTVVPGFGPLNTEEDVVRARRAYYAMCSRVDFLISQIMEHVDLTTTNVIITSDHGELAGAGRADSPEQRAGLFGKSHMYRQSTGVPMLLLGDVPRNKKCYTSVSLTDIHDTVIKQFGLTEYANVGESLFEIANERCDHNRLVFSQYHAFGAFTSAFMVADAEFQLNYYVNDENHTFHSELYDLKNDPLTLHDISKEHPSIVECYEYELKLHLDPEKISKRAKREQKTLIDSYGTREQALKISAIFATKLCPRVLQEVFATI